MSTEAMKLALRSLKELVPDDSDHAPAIQGQRKRQEIEYCTNYHCAGDCGQPHNQKEMQEFLASQPQQEPVAEYIGECNDGSLVQLYDDVKKGTKFYTSPPARKPLTAREIELLDGMIEVQLDHAARCDNMANRVMAEKQKGWDMERVELLRKLKGDA